MGVKAQTMTGARAKLIINGKVVGMFSTVSYGVTYGVTPIYVLGRFNAAELVYTDMDVVTVTATGFRAIGAGPHQIGGDGVNAAALNSVPHLQELLQHQDIQLSLHDRQNDDASYMLVTGVRPVSFDTDNSSRGVQGLTVRFQGTLHQDESGVQDDPGATNFPNG